LRVHISFAEIDRSYAQLVAQELRNAGHEPAFHNILETCGPVVNHDFSSIAKMMRSYDYMVPILSKSYLAEPWLPQELYGASIYEQLLRSPFIVPVLVDDTDLPLYVKEPVDLRDRPPEEWLPELLVRMVGLTQAFVIMRFGDSVLDDVYELVFKRAAMEFGLTSLRVDEVEDSETISHQVLKSIDRSLVIIADLTDERPNCYYEVGYADARGKQVILTAREGHKVHFDLAGRRVIFWQISADLLARLRSRLQSMRSDGLLPAV